jgi:hypothetical protein
MKIYVTNIPPSSIKLDKLDKYILNKDGYKKYELVSKEFGTHIIEAHKQNEPNMYRIEPTLNMDLHLINTHNASLLVDKTKYVHIPVVSQMPVDYILTKMTCFEYAIKNRTGSKIKMIVECFIENSNILSDKKIIPINYYFHFLDKKNNLDIDDNLLEEINMFLSELY